MHIKKSPVIQRAICEIYTAFNIICEVLKSTLLVVYALTLGHVAKHGVQNPAVAVVIDFHWRIDAAGCRELDFAAIRFGCSNGHLLARLQRIVNHNVKHFVTGQS